MGLNRQFIRNRFARRKDRRKKGIDRTCVKKDISTMISEKVRDTFASTMSTMPVKKKNVESVVENKEETVDIIDQKVVLEELEEVKKEIEVLEHLLDEIDEEMVICLNTKVRYKDNKEASEKTGVNAGSIKRCCNGSSKSAGKDENGNKLEWQYLIKYLETTH